MRAAWQVPRAALVYSSRMAVPGGYYTETPYRFIYRVAGDKFVFALFGKHLGFRKSVNTRA